MPLRPLPLPLPEPHLVRRFVWRTPFEKADYLDGAAALDACGRDVRALAARIVAPARSPLGALERIHAAVRDGIRYRHDDALSSLRAGAMFSPHEAAAIVDGRAPRAGEEFADADTILARGFDDCDGKCRVFVALVRAAAADVPRFRSLRALIQPVFRRPAMEGAPPAFYHVQALCKGAGTARHICALPGGWLLAELTLRGVPLGSGAEAAHRDPRTGKLAVA